MTTASKPISKMDGVELEEYAAEWNRELSQVYLGGFEVEASVIGKRWQALGHPAAADSWAEAAKKLYEAADSIEQAIKEVSDE